MCIKEIRIRHFIDLKSKWRPFIMQFCLDRKYCIASKAFCLVPSLFCFYFFFFCHIFCPGFNNKIPLSLIGLYREFIRLISVCFCLLVLYFLKFVLYSNKKYSKKNFQKIFKDRILNTFLKEVFIFFCISNKLHFADTRFILLRFRT